MRKWILSACTALALPGFAFAPQPPAAEKPDRVSHLLRSAVWQILCRVNLAHGKP